MQPQADDGGVLSGERLYRKPAVPPDGGSRRQVEPVIGRIRLARDQQTAIAVWHYPTAAKGTASPDAAFPQAVKKTLDRLQLRTIASSPDHGQATGQHPQHRLILGITQEFAPQ